MIRIITRKRIISLLTLVMLLAAPVFAGTGFGPHSSAVFAADEVAAVKTAYAKAQKKQPILIRIFL